MTQNDPPGPGAAGWRAKGRVQGIDLARALAIIGMLVVHLGPTDRYGLAGGLYAVPHGRSVVLFVLLAGLGVSLLFGARRSTVRQARLKLVWVALVLLLTGLALQRLPIDVWIILHYHAALFAVALLMVSLPDRGLWLIAGLSAVCGPLIYLAGTLYLPDWFGDQRVMPGDGPLTIVSGLVVTGQYPMITYLTPFAIGLWLGRRDLGDQLLRRNLIFRGASVTLLTLAAAAALQAAVVLPGATPGWDWLVSTRPHSQMPLWLIGSTGSAVLVLGVSLWAADALGKWSWPLVAFGQLALSVYVGHALLLALWPGLVSHDIGRAVVITLGLVIVACALAVLWRRHVARGPLETLMILPWIVEAKRRSGQGQ